MVLGIMIASWVEGFRKNGYAKVSTNDQDAQLQIDAPNSVGCDRIYEEKPV
jgi:DNA invertase Pin-like site-specific DNA recombinase